MIYLLLNNHIIIINNNLMIIWIKLLSEIKDNKTTKLNLLRKSHKFIRFRKKFNFEKNM